MLKSILKVSGFIAFMAWNGMVCATGLGGINVGSYLGQPLKAEIELVSVDKADRSSISAKLASAEAFKNAGVDYPYTLPKLKFEVVNRESGDPTIKLTSSQPVNEPFVTLLIEVTWSSGKLLREYTFLLDPVDFKPQEIPAETVKPIQPVVPVAPPVAVAPESAPTPEVVVAQPAMIQQEQSQPQAAPSTKEATVAPTEVVQPAPAQEAQVIEKTQPVEVQPEEVEEEEAVTAIEVERGDTLGKIAAQIKPDSISLERMLVALYRANADVFDGRNMNRIKAGKILVLPDSDSINGITQKAAVKEIRAQVADWNVYRQQLASARADMAGAAGRQESTGKISTAVSESAAAAKSPAKEVLKLSKGEAPGDKAVGAGKATAQEKANAKEEESIAKSKALKEAQERTALLEKNLKDMQRLADLKKSGTASQAGVTAASAPSAASAPVRAAPKVVAPVVVEQPSLTDELLNNPIMLAGVAALVLALGGVGFVLVRRKKTHVGKEEAQQERGDVDEGGATGRIAAPVMPSPETGDFTQSASPSVIPSQGNADEVDPIGEADLFLTFGRDVQAEEVLTEALKSNPGNMSVRLKLLSIYSNRKDTNAFYTQALAIKESGDAASWSLAAEMGRELEPGNPLYGGDGTSVPHVAEQKAEVAQPAVDFDLGFGSPAQPPSAPDFQGTVVMEAPAVESTTILSASELRATQETPMDFDVTGNHGLVPDAAPAESPSVNMDEMLFDVTSAHPGVLSQDTNSSIAEAPAGGNADDLIFDVTSAYTSAPVAEKPAPAAAPSAEEGLAFTLDFPTDFSAAPAVKEAAPVDIGLADISLNLGDIAATSPASTSESKDERWQEVATKLDLAKAYQEMGDADGAKEILDEVLRDGDEQQRASAEAMLQQL